MSNLKRFALVLTVLVVLVAGLLAATHRASAATVCSPATAVSVPYAKDGVADICVVATSLCGYINSWNLTTLEVNGTSYLNTYVAAPSIAPLNGSYTIHYVSTVAWGHFEIAGTCGVSPTVTTPPAGPTATRTSTPTTGPSLTPTRTPTSGGPTPTATPTKTGGTNSAGCGKTPGISSSQYNNGSTISITAAGMSRRYILNVPTNYNNTTPYKLIIAYHELNGNDKEMYANGYYHLLSLSNNSAIFVAPNGQKNGAACTGTGSGDSGCGWPNTNNSDLQLADAVVAQIAQNFCVNMDQIMVTGWSYGGSMSYKTACERPQGGTASWYVRGAAVYSGAVLSGSCTPTKPVAYYASHGTSDTVLSYDSGLGLFQNFASANQCTYQTPTKVTSGNHVCTTLPACMTGYPTTFCSFNGGHTPDPSDGGASWEYQNVWNFFMQLLR